MKYSTFVERIKKEIKKLKFKSYFPIEIDEKGNWKWTDDALETLTWYVYEKIRLNDKKWKSKFKRPENN